MNWDDDIIAALDSDQDLWNEAESTRKRIAGWPTVSLQAYREIKRFQLWEPEPLKLYTFRAAGDWHGYRREKAKMNRVQRNNMLLDALDEQHLGDYVD